MAGAELVVPEDVFRARQVIPSGRFLDGRFLEAVDVMAAGVDPEGAHVGTEADPLGDRLLAAGGRVIRRLRVGVQVLAAPFSVENEAERLAVRADVRPQWT